MKSKLATRFGLAALSLSLLVPVLPAAAFDRVSETGQQAIQELIAQHSNRNTRAVFQSTQRRSTGNDVILTGRGYTTRGNGRDGGLGRGNGNGNGQGNARDFTYSVRVTRNGDSARDVRVRFTNGETLSGSGTYYRDRQNDRDNNDRNDRATFVKPESGFTDTDGNVTFEGRSDARTVTLTILDRGSRNGNADRVVSTRRVNVSNGRWATNLNLNEGDYRARIESGNGTNNRGASTVNFRVDRNGDGRNDDPRRDDTRATFDRPDNNFVDKDGEIRFSGDSEGREIELKVYRGNREVLSRRVGVRDDRWEHTMRLDNGDYRATVRTVDGGRTATVRFRVERN